jgi:hypothetical protein
MNTLAQRKRELEEIRERNRLMLEVGLCPQQSQRIRIPEERDRLHRETFHRFARAFRRSDVPWPSPYYIMTLRVAHVPRTPGATYSIKVKRVKA